MNDSRTSGPAAPSRAAACPGRSRWAWIVSTVAALGAGLVLAFLLVDRDQQPALLRAPLRLAVLGQRRAREHCSCWSSSSPAVRLLWRVSRGKFGSRLLLKLAAIFALVGVVPGVLIYTVSYQFVSRSIESWFDVKVEGALDAGLTLGRGTIDAHRQRPRDQDPAGRRAPRRERAARPSRSRSSGCASSSSAQDDRDRRQRRPDPARDRQQRLGGLMPERPPPHAAAPGAHAARRQPGRRPRRGAARRRDRADARACAPSPLIPSSNFTLGEQERYLRRHPGAARRRSPPTRSRCTSAYREYQQRALARARAAQDVHRHADAGAGARRVRRAAAGDRAQQPARAAAAAARRGRAPGGARRLQLEGGVRARATSSAG